MRIRFMVVGKTREQFLQQGEQFYQERLAPFCQLEWVIVREEKGTAGKTGDMIREKEGARILEQWPRRGYVVALDTSGKPLSSEEFARFLQEAMNSGQSEMTFIIGGALGLDEKVRLAATHRLSLSRMTFTHEMTRLILLEQLYRSFTILKGSKYHK